MEKNKNDMQEPEKEENFAELLEQSFVGGQTMDKGSSLRLTFITSYDK
jgi:hypothetical protein